TSGRGSSSLRENGRLDVALTRHPGFRVSALPQRPARRLRIQFVHSSASGHSAGPERRPQATFQCLIGGLDPPPCSEATSRKGLAPLGGPFWTRRALPLRETRHGAAHSSP